MENKVKYDSYNSCNKCGNSNSYEVVATDEGYMSECHTTCNHCGFEDYWAYGWYESGQDGYNSCSKYTANQCRI